MPGKDIDSVREQTDESLCTERHKTDDLLDRVLHQANNLEQNRQPERAKELGREHSDLFQQREEADYGGELRRALERERRARTRWCAGCALTPTLTPTPTST
jgi:hypothetical protein